MRVTQQTIYSRVEGLGDNELNEVANFIGYLKMKRDNAFLHLKTDVYEVADPEEEAQLVRALNESNPLLTEEEINTMLGQ